MTDRTIESVNRRAVMTVSGAALIAPFAADQVQPQTASSVPEKLSEGLTISDKTLTQSAIDAAAGDGRQLHAPAGEYPHASLPNGIRLRGEGPEQSVFARASNTDDVLTNASASVSEMVTLQNLKISGGRYGLRLKASGSPANYHLTDVTFQGSARADLYSDSSLILCKFDKVIFNGLADQLIIVDGTANANYWLGCEWIELGGTAIKFGAASEANEIISGRFEARRVSDSTGKTVLDLNATRGLRIRGGYFEAVHRTIVTEVNSLDNLWFENTRFSGQETGASEQERFVSDGAVGFDGCDFNAGSYGARQMMTKGRNRGLDTRLSWLWTRKDDRVTEVVSPRIALTNKVAKPLLAFARPQTAPGADNRCGLRGRIDILITGATAQGDPIFTSYSRSFVIGHNRFDGSSVMAIGFGSVEDQANIAGGTAPSIILSGIGSDADSLVLGAGIDVPGGIDGAEMTATIRCEHQATATLEHIVVSPVLASGPPHPSA